MKCHSCGNDGEGMCVSCEQCVCDKCSVPYTYHNPVDYDLCQDCGDSRNKAMADEMQQELEYEKEQVKLAALELAKSPQRKAKERQIIDLIYKATNRNLHD